jgi:pseudouridine-5'-phosphate glycosidase
VRGQPVAGLEHDDLERFLAREGILKVSARDLAFAMTRKQDGATTVAATLALCSVSGIEVFATGGIGGVHRGAPFDESADLVELSRSPVIVVCAGAKSILDLQATLERLESLGVTVVGYRTNELPGFFTETTGLPLDCSVNDVDQIAELWNYHRALGRAGAVLVVQRPPAEFALPADLVDRARNEAMARAEREGISQKAVTPFLLREVMELTEGKSVQVNIALLEANARLAGEIAARVAATQSDRNSRVYQHSEWFGSVTR